MKLLILTQKVDVRDDVLGFMHGWINEFSRQVDRVTVICLQKGEYNFSPNVSVLSLGKEGGISRLKYTFNFFRYIWRERGNYDAVFVHMNPEYVVLGGWLWRLWGKVVALWYAHGHVTTSLRIAERLVDVIFTSTASGCRLKSGKIKVIGQGIDVDKFQVESSKPKIDGVLKIVTVGRISPSKDYETLIEAAGILRERGWPVEVSIVGGVGLAGQEEYYERVKSLVAKRGLEEVIEFVGAVANDKIVPLLQGADIFVNMGHTGSLDKAVLEAMSVGLPSLTCNEAFEGVLGGYADELMYPKKDSRALADRLERLAKMSAEERRELGLALRQIIVRDHSLEKFVNKIVNFYGNII